jgi:RHS repeat-associated protein
VTGSAVTKYYFFAGQRIAMRVGNTLYYLHGDRVPPGRGSTSLATDSTGGVGNPVRDQGYYAYGRYRRGGTLPTDHKFTGQKLDGSGLYYYGARYYDPQIGLFLSPDTLIPDPASIWDYNRLMYTRGNPLKFIDPTGHETSKPEWWPDWLPYTFDLPDGMTQEQFIEWVSENNITTTFGGQLGLDFSGRLWGGASASIEGGWMINWWSGELSYHVTSAMGPNVGLGPDLSIGGHLGATWVAGAQSIKDSVQGYSAYRSVGVQGKAVGTLGGSATVSQALDADPTAEIFLLSEINDPLIDPTFSRTVDGLSLNATAGIEPPGMPLDVSYNVGVSRTSLVQTFNLYAPFVNIYQRWFGR